MMILSLIGSFAGFSWRGIGVIGVVFAVVFIGVVFYTFKSWKGEDQEKLEGELERIRDQLSTECRRVASEVQREKQARLSEFIEQVKRTISQRADDLMRDRQQREQAALAEQRERARIRTRKLDQQLKEVQALGSRFKKLRDDSVNLFNDAERAVRDLAQKKKLSA